MSVSAADTRLARALLEGPAQPPCPSDDRLFDLASGALEATEAQALVLHTGRCGACALGLQLARDLLESAPAVLRVRRPVPLSRRLSVVGAWTGAALLAAAAVLVWPRPQGGDPATIERAASGPAILALAPARASTGAPVVLRWTPVAGARYKLTVATAALSLLHQETGLLRAEATLPATLLAGQPPGTALVWRVEAQLPDGSTVASRSFLLQLE